MSRKNTRSKHRISWWKILLKFYHPHSYQLENKFCNFITGTQLKHGKRAFQGISIVSRRMKSFPAPWKSKALRLAERVIKDARQGGEASV